MYTVELSEVFDRRADRFFRQHPDLRQRFAKLLVDLKDDPFQPRLRLHKPSGRLDRFHAVRLTYSYRVILILVVAEDSITLVDIGTHDQVYR